MQIQLDLRPSFFDSLRKIIKAEVLEVLQGQTQKTEEIEGYLSVKSAAKYLDISERTINRWCSGPNKKLTKVYINGISRIEKKAIEDSIVRFIPLSGGKND